MELDKALLQISEIHRHLAQTEVFRGYRSATTLFSAIVALIGCAVQAWLLPRGDVGGYLLLWMSAAVLSLIVVGAEMYARSRRSSSPVQRELTLVAVEQFTPAIVAGGLLTYVLHHAAGHTLWMLPGLWSLLFSLGVFSSRRVLPRGIFVIGGWYLLAGVLCLSAGPQDQLPPPWQMALCFGVGQTLTASILYWNLERRHAAQE